jgi:hypothetical protein
MNLLSIHNKTHHLHNRQTPLCCKYTLTVRGENRPCCNEHHMLGTRLVGTAIFFHLKKYSLFIGKTSLPDLDFRTR